ncbi:MAG TPA: glycosyltransferase [Gaiellaceae bacterium]|nr:glycosyltransferase [Gaiellaceae bacterium]
MRVALVTHQFFPAFYTGVERLTLNLAKHLRLIGHDAIVITSAGHSARSPAPYSYDGTWVVPIQVAPVDPARPWAHAGGSELGATLDREGIDIVHVMQPMRLPGIFDEASRRGLPLIAHAPDFFYPCSRVTMVRVDESICPDAELGNACVAACGIATGHDRFEWGRDVLDLAAAVVSPSRFALDVHAKLGFDTSHWHHIPWGVDYALHPSRLPPPAGERLVVGFLGTVLRHKGPHVLVNALRLAPDAPVELRVYGGSFHESGYERDLHQLAAGDKRITFHGSYAHDELRLLLAELDVVAIPSLWHENLPTVGLNALASGVPVIGSEVGGIRELVDDYSGGFTFQPDDAPALASLLEALAADRSPLIAVRQRLKHPPGVEEEAFRVSMLYERAVSR